ncbi:MAG TPA: hypothetical protein VF808_09600 [Ktedonobacterales bacterium]
MREIVPANRWITVALVAGILALIAYGAFNHDPAAILILATLVLFFATPATLVYLLNRQRRRRDP